jgi:hypothetical protein
MGSSVDDGRPVRANGRFERRRAAVHVDPRRPYATAPARRPLPWDSRHPCCRFGCPMNQMKQTSRPCQRAFLCLKLKIFTNPSRRSSALTSRCIAHAITHRPPCLSTVRCFAAFASQPRPSSVSKPLCFFSMTLMRNWHWTTLSHFATIPHSLDGMRTIDEIFRSTDCDSGRAPLSNNKESRNLRCQQHEAAGRFRAFGI